jgi:hypothetical protein
MSSSWVSGNAKRLSRSAAERIERRGMQSPSSQKRRFATIPLNPLARYSKSMRCDSRKQFLKLYS